MTQELPTLGVIIVAAGSGQRFGDEAKVLFPIAGKPMLKYSLDLFSSMDAVSRIVVVASEHSLDKIEALVAETCPDKSETCLGGVTRRDSVQRGFERISNGVDYVVVHDAARPLARPDMIRELIQAAVSDGAAVPVLPLGDTVYRVDAHDAVLAVEDRAVLRAAQTPQISRTDWLADALGCEGEFTDEGSALVACGYPVATVMGSPENIKITWPEDVKLAEYLLGTQTAR